MILFGFLHRSKMAETYPQLFLCVHSVEVLEDSMLMLNVINSAFFVSPGVVTRSSATADEPRDALCQLKSCQL